MSAPAANSQNPPIAVSSNATAAPASSSGSSANVAAGSAPPTARTTYASATKKASPAIVSSGTPPVAVGAPQSAQHGNKPAASPLNGQKGPMAPAIANSSGIASADHSRKSSVTISAPAPGSMPNGGQPTRAASGLTFGALSSSPSPAASHAVPHMPQGLNPQSQNPRVASPTNSPSPIPQFSGGKPNNMAGERPQIAFGGSESEQHARPNVPQQPTNMAAAQHLRRESSQSGHGEMPTFTPGRTFQPNNRRGPGGPFPPAFTPQMGHPSPQQARPLPYQAGRGVAAPVFQPQNPGNMRPHVSPFGAPRSPHINPVAMVQQQQYLNNGQMPYYPPSFPAQPGYPIPAMDGYNPYYNYPMPPQGYMPMPQSPRSGSVYPAQPMPQPFVPAPQYGQPQAGGMNMSRTPSQLSERPPSAAPAPSTPAMTNVNHVSHTPTPSVGGSPAPGGTFVPPKKSKAIIIKNPNGEVINFDDKKTASPAPPAQPRSPAIVSTPTPPPRAPSTTESAHGRTESVATEEERRAAFVKQFKSQLAGSTQEEADKKAAEEKKAEEEAKEKAAKEEAEKKAKEEAEKAEKAAKEEADKKAKEEAEKAAKEEADKKAKEAEAEAAKKKEDEEAKKKEDAEAKKKADDEEMERMIADMEAAERAEAEREKAYAEKKAKEAEAKKAEEATKEQERLRQQEREAEELEEKRSKQTQPDTESAALFASLKKNTMFGPQATAVAETAPAPPAETSSEAPKTAPARKGPPANLKLDASKSVEPAQPSAAMQSLRSARFLQVRDELTYPDGFKSPNPALNMGAKKGRQYDKDFLLQFQDVFKEKPSPDWDQKLKETVGDSSEGRAASSRGGLGSRQASQRGMTSGPGATGAFGQFGITRTLPPGTTSEQRFQQATQGGARGPPGGMVNPLANMVSNQRGAGAFPMGRTSSFQAAPNSPRVGSGRGRGSRRGDKGPRKDEEQMARTMPLTANLDPTQLKLERSTTGWKPHSQTSTANAVLPSGHMAPDLVQRKVKAALNKMTPEKFDKIADQILEIAAQSKDENDGRTLRQVIQLTFEKACDEAHWASMYAKFAERMLRTMSPDIKDENVKDKHGNPVVGGALFRKYLLNRCQEEFERGWEVNLPPKPEGQESAAAVILSDEYYIAAAAKRKGLGLIQFIGELYKLKMLTLRIMHECVLKLLDFEGMPDESAIESLTKLIRTVGSTMQQEEAGPKMLQVYFERIEKIMNFEGLPSRLRFMLLDIVDLRKANWVSKDSNKGPKTIAEIHQEAAAAQQAAEAERSRSQRGPRPPVGRGDVRSFSSNMGPPQDYPSSRVQMDDLRKLSKGASGRNTSAAGQLGPSMLGSRSSSRRGLGPGGLIGRGDESGASSRTGTPPQKEKESTTHMNSFSALAALENEGAGEVGSPPSSASSPPVQRATPADDTKDSKPSE